MAKPPHLTLIDGSGFIFRAYHRLPPLTDPEGTPVGAVFGLILIIYAFTISGWLGLGLIGIIVGAVIVRGIWEAKHPPELL